MTTRKITRTIELTVEKRETLSMRSSHTVSERCEACGSGATFATPEEIARQFAVKQREIFRLLEVERIGYDQMPDGAVLICTKCFERERKDRK
jgi:hypothetical protein